MVTSARWFPFQISLHVPHMWVLKRGWLTTLLQSLCFSSVFIYLYSAKSQPMPSQGTSKSPIQASSNPIQCNTIIIQSVVNSLSILNSFSSRPSCLVSLMWTNRLLVFWHDFLKDEKLLCINKGSLTSCQLKHYSNTFPNGRLFPICFQVVIYWQGSVFYCILNTWTFYNIYHHVSLGKL